MKKLLALVLSAVMLLSAIPMAGAASFSDSADITLMTAEAVDVMSDLKIVTGFPEGTFKPNDTLTRAQAAKILCCVVLGTTAADALPAGGSTFSDVPASNWANKYVEYCASKGIVSGVGSNKFDPNGKLTGTAFGKMLLVALGADASKFSGSGWDKAVQTQLKEKQLDFGVAVSGSDITRQDACRLALNALFDGERTDAESTLAYKVFGVTRTAGGNNSKQYNRPYNKYVSTNGDAYWAGTDKKVTASPIYFKANGAVKGGDLVKALGVTDIEPADFVSYRNGIKASASKSTVLHTGNKKTHSFTGSGVQFEVYYAADTGKYTFIHLYYFAEKIAEVVPTTLYSDGTVEIPGKITFESGRVYESTTPNDFTEADVGKYVCVRGIGKGSMHKMGTPLEVTRGTIVTGTLDNLDAKKGITVDGKLYKFPGWIGTENTTKKYISDGSGNIGDQVNLLLTNDNYALMLWKA